MRSQRLNADELNSRIAARQAEFEMSVARAKAGGNSRLCGPNAKQQKLLAELKRRPLSADEARAWLDCGNGAGFVIALAGLAARGMIYLGDDGKWRATAINRGRGA
jgi:hypothetical protein